MAKYQQLMLEETEVDEVGQVTIVKFAHKHISDMVEIEELGAELYQLLEQQARKRIVVDFSDVQFFSSAAIGKLISLNGKFKARGGVMKLCDVGAEILDVFQVCKLDTLFKIHVAQQEALDSFEN